MRQTNIIAIKSRRTGMSYMNSFEFQKRIMRISRILKIYNILQKVKDT